MKLTFLILTYKTFDLTRLCISNIQQLRLNIDYEIIVVDNNSGDDTVPRLKKLFPSVRCIQSPKNVGHPAGNNIGLRVATGEYIAMINPDIIFKDPQDVYQMLEYMEQHQRVAILGPRLLNVDGTVQYTCYRPYSRWTPLYRRTFLGKLSFARRDIERHLMTDFDHQSTKPVAWLLGACYIIRRAALDDIGVMDERFFLYFGDYEWCDRARRKNWQVVYFHAVKKIYHYHKRESLSHRFSVIQLFSYVTRIHVKDWMTYSQIKSYDTTA